MKKLFFSFVLFAITFNATTQEIPQITPASPEAASLGKYGEIPVNLATGKINYSVPLYTIDINGFQWPIYLSYNYNGLVAEQDHPMTGIGWDLMATGRITRQVRGMPDERGGSNSYKQNHIIPYMEWDYSTGSFPENDLATIYENLATKAFDGQQDKYHINAGGLSGSFVYNVNNDAVFLNYRNYKVEGTSLGGLKVTDENGIQYFFNKKENGNYTVYDDGQISIPVSYLLTQIKLPNNQGEIDFEYHPSTAYTKTVFSETEITGFGIGTTHTYSQDQNTINNTPLYKIKFPNGEVRFDKTTATDGQVVTNALNTVSVWYKNAKVLEYDLDYSNPSKNLKTLNSISKVSGSQTLPYYEFEYHSLPTFMDYKRQDFWGFYNGRANASLLDGNKEIDFNNTLKGALKTIHYPTKGTTEITYEQNAILSTDTNSNNFCSYSHNKTVTGQLIGNASGKDIDTIIQVPANQVVYVYAYAEVGLGTATNMFGAESFIDIQTTGGACNYMNINIHESINGEDVGCSFEPGSPPCPPTHREIDSQTEFTDDGKIHIRGRVLAPQGKHARIHYTITYEDRPNQDKFVGGIRVAQTKDCAETGNCITTDYEYVQEDGKSSGKLLGAPAIFKYNISYSGPPPSYTGSKTYRSAYSMQNFSSFQGSPALYTRVETIKNGGSNGKVVQHFSAFSNPGSGANPYIDKENNNWKTGKLLKTEVFKKTGSTYTLQQVQENIYDEFFPYGYRTQSTLKAYSLAVARTQIRIGSASNGFPGGTIEGDPDDYRELTEIDYPKAYKLVSSTSTEFHASGDLISITNYEYDPQRLLLKERRIFDSEGNSRTVKTLYPHDLNNTTLIAQNRVATPLRTINYKQIARSPEVKLFSQNTVFGTKSGNYVPVREQISKGNNSFEDRLSYRSYTNTGRLKEVSKKDGTKVYYVWGYDHMYPIAKIEGYTSISSTQLSYINQAITASNNDTSTSTENTLRTKLTQLRNGFASSNVQVTSYTYDPIIGVTSITDPRGDTTFYYYDDFNRLEYVKDAQGNILSKKEYNYKN
jgi:YD repeat-containing protein